MKKKELLNSILTFLVILLLVSFAKDYFFPTKIEDPTKKGQIILTTTSNEYNQNSPVIAEIENNSSEVATLKNRCPKEPLEVLVSVNDQWTPKTTVADITCEDAKDVIIQPGQKQPIGFVSWNHALFGETGRYKLKAHLLLSQAAPSSDTSKTTGSEQSTQTTGTQSQQNLTTETRTTEVGTSAPNSTKTIESPEFQIKPEGFFSKLWTSVFYQPLYNVLISLINIAPGKNLGFAIILLTIIIRTILLVPSQNALKSQRKMQELQPKLNKIKEKYKDNQEMLAKETMALWKENKTNPMGSCLPILIQIPILIALYSVIQSGLNPDNSYLLYNFLKNFSFHDINGNFLNLLNLTKVNPFVLPLIVGGLQFLQMKLATLHTKKKKSHNQEEKAPKNEMEIATNTMMYIMPVMIAYFTSQVPAGVGLYWAVSTLYGIAQQMVVNRQSDKGEVKVRVLPNPKS